MHNKYKVACPSRKYHSSFLLFCTTFEISFIIGLLYQNLIETVFFWFLLTILVNVGNFKIKSKCTHDSIHTCIFICV